MEPKKQPLKWYKSSAAMRARQVHRTAVRLPDLGTSQSR